MLVGIKLADMKNIYSIIKRAYTVIGWLSALVEQIGKTYLPKQRTILNIKVRKGTNFGPFLTSKNPRVYNN